MHESSFFIILFACLYIGLILLTRRKANFEEYAVAGRGVGGLLIFASLAASYIGPTMTLGLARNGFNNGFFLCYVVIFNGIALMLSGNLLAPRIRSRFTRSYSLGDIIGGPLTHHHKSVQLFAGLTSFCLMTAICIAMSYGGGELINHVFGFPKRISIFIITAVVILYAFFGGIRATIQTDLVQFVLFALLIPSLGAFLVLDDDFQLPEFRAHARAATQAAFDVQTAMGIFGMALFWFMSSGFDSMIVHRYLAAKNVRTVRRATTFAGLFIMSWAVIMVSLGVLGAYLHPDFADNDQLLLHLASAHFPTAMYGMFLIAMMGAVMSTQDSALNAASVLFTEDVLGAFVPEMSPRSKLLASRVITILIGLLAILVAAYISSILSTIIAIFSIYIPVMLPVLLFSVFKKRHYWPSALAAMVTGLGGYLLWAGSAYTGLLPPILVASVLSAGAYVGVDAVGRRR